MKIFVYLTFNLEKKSYVSKGSILLRSKVLTTCIFLIKDSSDDIIFIRVPAETYFRRPCHGGERIYPNLGFDVWRLFARNLGVVTAQPLEDREIEVISISFSYILSFTKFNCMMSFLHEILYKLLVVINLIQWEHFFLLDYRRCRHISGCHIL